MSLSHVSASQIRKYEECPRRWYESYVLGNREPETEKMHMGTEIHEEVEHYLNSGEVRESKWASLVRAVVPFVPIPGSRRMFIEQEFYLPTGVENINCKGYLDLGYKLPDGTPVITDWKSKDRFDAFCLTESQLLEDIQLTTYAQWLFSLESKWDRIWLRLIYVRRQVNRAGAHEVKQVYTLITREQAQARWDKTLASVREMAHWDAVHPATSETLPPTLESCGIYGGCFYRPKCGFASLDNFFPAERLNTMGIKERIAQSRAAEGALGVLPPDAPPRERAPADKQELILYVDCFPTKGEQAIYMEEWLAPIQAEVSAANKTKDFRLIDYKGKGFLAAAIRDKVSTLPKAILVSTKSSLAEIFIECVSPLTTQVIQGVR